MIIEEIEHINDTGSELFFLIAGPCVVENEEIVYKTASEIKCNNS